MAMPDHESLQHHSNNSFQSSETMERFNGRDTVETTVPRIEMHKSSTVDDGIERNMSRSDNSEGSTQFSCVSLVRAPIAVAQQALTRLTHENWIEIAEKILSVGQLTVDKLPELAYMVSFCASYISCTLLHNIIHSMFCKKLDARLHTICLCVCWLLM